VALGEAIKSIDTSVIEIHISNTFAREDFRHTSYITPVAKGLIIGFGLDSYRLGVESVLEE
jgi:3-dehydroquinate dehydratase-2